MRNNEVFTIGHSNLPIEKMIELLEANRIKSVCDVRSVPHSRFPQFNKETLAKTLQKSGIDYFFLGNSLGGRIDDATCYKAKEISIRKINIAELIDYDELVKRFWFQEGIERLIDILMKSKTTIMCSEENPARCHRNLLIARKLIDLKINVYHIRGNGALETAVIVKGQDHIQQKLF